ncbi:MAG: winged helix-turn-helix domain-containing protein [Pseudomonadota bacterium]
MQVSKVLVVDGDRAVRDALIAGLRFVGLEAHGADGTLAARSWLQTGGADVMVLSDLLLDCAPGELFDSPECRARTAIVMLTSGAALALRPNYLADATLLRPISLGRVVEQVESLLAQRKHAEVEPRCEFGSLSLDVAGARATVGEGAVHLGRTEARLLQFFMNAPDKVFSRAQLLERLWPSSVRVEERTVDVHIRRLRLALAIIGCADYVQTVRGSGYRFSALPHGSRLSLKTNL